MNSIVGNMKDAMDFRLFLRNYFYPKNQQFIQNNLYSYIQGIDDIDFVSAVYGHKLDFFKDIPCVLDLSVARSVDFNDIYGR